MLQLPLNSSGVWEMRCVRDERCVAWRCVVWVELCVRWRCVCCVRWVVCEIEMSCVCVSWGDELCVSWVVWDELVCDLSCVSWVVWDELCKMRCVRDELRELSCVWDELCEMCVRWVVWVELCELSCVVWERKRRKEKAAGCRAKNKNHTQWFLEQSIKV